MSTSINTSVPPSFSQADTTTRQVSGQTGDFGGGRSVPETKESPSVVEIKETNKASSSAEDLTKAVSTVQSYVDVMTSRALSIRVDDELNRPVVSVIDKQTEEVVRQIPSEEVIALARFLQSQTQAAAKEEALTGILLNSEV